MKTNKIIKTAIIISVIVAVVAVVGVLAGCQKEEKSSESSKPLLDLDVSALSSVLSEEQASIIRQGQELINENAIYEDRAFHLTVNSGAEIGMSERLFNFYKANIAAQNEQIKDIDLVEVAPGVFIDVNNIDVSSIRLKRYSEGGGGGDEGVYGSWGLYGTNPMDGYNPTSDISGNYGSSGSSGGSTSGGGSKQSSVTTTYGVGYYEMSTFLNNVDALNFMNGMQAIYSYAGGLQSFVSLFFTSNALTLVVGGSAFLYGQCWSMRENDYINNSPMKGIKLNMVSVGTPVGPAVSYNIEYIK